MTFLLVINGILIITIVALVSRKYESLLNPIALFGAFFFIATVLTPMAYIHVHLMESSQAAMSYTVVLSAIYFATLGTAFLVKFSPFRVLVDFLVRLSQPLIIMDGPDLALLGIELLALQFIVVYIILMIASDTGVMWLTNPRVAYQYYRVGVGVWWSLAVATLMLLFVAAIFRWGRTSTRVFLLAALFFFISLRLGSKTVGLVYFVMGAFFVQYRIRSIRVRTLLFGSALLLCLAMVLQLVQRTAGSLAEAMSYFDYFWHSARFIQEFRRFGFQYGAITLSDVWYYVPRALYPAKPFGYGLALIDNWLYPGLAKRFGYTPGLLQWVVGYGDFGVIGVVGSAAVDGLIAKGVFEYFLEHRNFVAFVLLTQLGFVYNVELFFNCPFPIFWLWFMTQGLMFWTLRSLGRQDFPRVAVMAR